jgi:hypothetical protein
MKNLVNDYYKYEDSDKYQKTSKKNKNKWK